MVSARSVHLFYGPALLCQAETAGIDCRLLSSWDLSRMGRWSRSGSNIAHQTQNSHFSLVTKHQQCFSTLPQKNSFIGQFHHFGKHNRICLKCGRTYHLNYFSRLFFSSCVHRITSDRTDFNSSLNIPSQDYIHGGKHCSS